MFGLFGGNFYYLIIALQAICVFHCVRKGNQGKWIWIIVILPGIGSLIYIFTEIITRRDINNVQSNISTIIYPVGRIKDLERKLEFSNTFDNKVALADAYLASGSVEKAISLYESCLTGIFNDNEYVISKLVIAYYKVEQYEDAIKWGQKLLKSTEFNKSQAHIIYALSLEKSGKTELAENELKSMKGKYSNFECRLNYGQFLVRNNKEEQAKEVFNEILHEASHIKGGEARNNNVWFRKTREELAKIS
ncbi:MAG: PLDc N-terminal domain-containing protein [Bacteroidia bacterium]